MVALTATAVFLLAAAGVLCASVLALRLLGRASNRARPLAQRRRLAALAALAALAIPGAAAAGFAGIAAVLYHAQTATTAPP